MTTEYESINGKVDRIERIIETLETGDVSLEEAKALREEGRSLLAELEEDLDVGDGTVVKE